MGIMNEVTTGSDKGLLSIRHTAFTWTNEGSFSIRPV